MERHEIRLAAKRSAAFGVIVPIAGMLGGLFIGAVRASIQRLTDIAQIACVVRWGITGFFAGLGLVVLLALQPRREDVISIRRLMALVVVAALIAWFFSRVLSGVIGYEGF